jgi:hypothetical protein
VLEAELLKEVADEIEALNGRPTSTDRCRDAYARFQAEPDEAHRLALQAAYEAVPGHLRKFLLHDMDNKDSAIRVAIYGGEAI